MLVNKPKMILSGFDESNQDSGVPLILHGVLKTRRSRQSRATGATALCTECQQQTLYMAHLAHKSLMHVLSRSTSAACLCQYVSNSAEPFNALSPIITSIYLANAGVL